MKLQVLAVLVALVACAMGLPSFLEARQDDEGIIVTEEYLEAATQASGITSNGTLPETGPVAQAIPPGRISQDCDAGVDTDYPNAVAGARWLKRHSGKHTAPKNKCKRVHRKGHTCFWLCAKVGATASKQHWMLLQVGKKRTVFNQRIGVIADDIIVGCSSIVHVNIRGKDVFPHYNVWITDTCS